MHVHSVVDMSLSPTWPLQWIGEGITDRRGASLVTWSCLLRDMSRLGKAAFECLPSDLLQITTF